MAIISLTTPAATAPPCAPEAKKPSHLGLIYRVSAIFFQIIQWVIDAYLYIVKSIGNILTSCCTSPKRQEFSRIIKALCSYNDTCEKVTADVEYIANMLPTRYANENQFFDKIKKLTEELKAQLGSPSEESSDKAPEKELSNKMQKSSYSMLLDSRAAVSTKLRELLSNYPSLPTSKMSELTVELIQTSELEFLEHHDRVIDCFGDYMRLMDLGEEEVCQFIKDGLSLLREIRESDKEAPQNFGSEQANIPE